MYMNVRIPLPINSNPGMVFPPCRFRTVHDVAHFAARLLDGIVGHKEMLDSGELPLERAASREKNQPLCMAQYYRLLGSCRRPGVERDSQYLPRRELPPDSDEDRHVVVICRNQMYCVVLQANDRGKLSESEIASQILYVLSDAPCLPGKPAPIGLLTAEPRARWAVDRERLQRDERNQRNLELIETALVVLCLDEPLGMNFNARGFSGATPTVHTAGDRDETNMAHEMIHGGGSEFNSGNRWFDKTMQVSAECVPISRAVPNLPPNPPAYHLYRRLVGSVLRALHIGGHCCGAAAREDLQAYTGASGRWQRAAPASFAAARASRVACGCTGAAAIRPGSAQRGQGHRQLGFLCVSLQGLWQEFHQVVPGQPRCLHTAGPAVGPLQVSSIRGVSEWIDK